MSFKRAVKFSGYFALTEKTFNSKSSGAEERVLSTEK